MKRIISLMLSAMLMFSGITVANADTTADGVGINRWNGFLGDGITTLNPTDNSDDVVKLTAGEEATLSLDDAVSGNMLITVDFYAEAAQDSTITALASDGTTVMGSFALAADGSYEAGKWQTAKILIFPDGKLYRTYLGDTYLGEGEISTASLSLEKIKFSAGGDLYINNISVSDYTTPILPESKLRTVYSSNFAGTTSTTTKISALDGWSANAADETIGYYLVPDPKNSSENAVKVERTAVNSTDTNRFAKGLSFANSVYEMKLYIPSKLSDGTTDNPANFKMFMRTSNYVNPTVVWIRSNGAATVGVPEVGRFTAPLDEWFTLKLNINMDAQTIDVYVGDEKVSDEPISLLKADGTPATNCTEIDLEVPRESSSGIAYFKDISVKEQDPVKVAANVDKTMIYEQNFDDETVGATVPDFTFASRDTTSSLTFTTAASGTAGATSKIGMLNDPTYTDASIYRFTDAGAIDTSATKETSKSQEWWYYDISDKTANLDNITLSFKYYNAKNAGKDENCSLSRDHLFAGFATGMGDTATGNMNYASASSIATYMKPGNSKVALMENASRTNGTNVAIGIRAWKDLSLTITKNADNTATAKIKSGTTEDTYPLTSFPTISKLSFQLDELTGGKYYIDDIEVYSAEYTEEVLYTENELKDISTAVTVPVYTNTITRNNVPAFTIDGINFSDGTVNVSAENSVSSVDVTQWKTLDANVNAWLYTAAYDAEGRLLKAQKQELTSQTLTEKVTVDVSDISCEGAEYAKAFIWSDDLEPLAEGYFVGKKITVWIAGSSTAQDYTAERYPQAGWGQMIDPYFYENSVTVNNKAVGGRSSKSFIQEGRLDEILASGQPGDYLMIYFGGNDASKAGMLEYTDPTLGWDVVDSNPDGYSADASYKYYLKQYVDGAKEKGMIPVFVTVLPMFGYKDGVYVGANYAINHVNAMIDLGEELGVPVADLNTPFDNAMASMGEEAAKKHFMIFKFADYANDPKFSPDYHIASGNYDAETDLYVDNVHINELGADLCAQIIAEEIKDMPIGLSNYIK